MFNEIIFSPDPRFPENELIGVDDEQQYNIISIQLSSDGKFYPDDSHSALLQLDDKGFYELLTFDPEKEYFKRTLYFSDTHNYKTVCENVEELFNQGRLKPFFIDEDSKPKLVFG